MFPASFSIARIALTSVAAGAIGLLGVYSTGVLRTTPIVDMRIEPTSGIVQIDDTFTTSVVVESDIAVNAFSGVVTFDSDVLRVAEIDYNTSIANLWVTEPWYSNGDGTITFAGGTTQTGGFTGTGDLITITFQAESVASTSIGFRDANIYTHDGFGTSAPLLESVDALFTVESLSTQANPIPGRAPRESVLRVVTTPPNYDLNGDGTINLRDVSIFMLNLFGNNSAYDFNQDGVVNTADLQLLLRASRDQN